MHDSHTRRENNVDFDESPKRAILYRSVVSALLTMATLATLAGCSSSAGPSNGSSSADDHSLDGAPPNDAPVSLSSPDAPLSSGNSTDASSTSHPGLADAGHASTSLADANAAPTEASLSDTGASTVTIDGGTTDGSASHPNPDGGSADGGPGSPPPDGGSSDGGSALPPPGGDGGPTTYAMLPNGTVNLSVSVEPAGPVYRMACAGGGSSCTIPTQQVVVSTSSVSPVSCTLTGTNPGGITASCTLTAAYPYPSSCVVGDPGNCTWGVRLEPTWGPADGAVANDGSFSLTFGTPYAQNPVGAVFTGRLLPIIGGSGTALAVSLTAYTGSDSSTTPWGAAPICGSGTCGAVCYVGGSVYASGYADPASRCQSCQPTVSGTSWSTSADGTSCGAGDICASGTCGAQCIIGGDLYENGAVNPGNVCQACASSLSTSGWSPVADGKSCGGGEVCVAGACGGCTISGTTYASGASNPSNICQSCQPATSTTEWSDFPDGTVCGPNAGNNRMLCQYGRCGSVAPDDPNYCDGTPITTEQAQALFSGGATTVTIARYQTEAATLICGTTDCSPWAPDSNAGPWLGVVDPSNSSVWLPGGGNVVLTEAPGGAVSLSLVSDPVTTFGGTLQTSGYTQNFSPALGSGQSLTEQSFGGWPYSQLYFKDLGGPGNQSGTISVAITNHCLQVWVTGAQVNVTEMGETARSALVVFFATF